MTARLEGHPSGFASWEKWFQCQVSAVWPEESKTQMFAF